MRAVSEHTPSTVRINNRRLLLDRFLDSDAITIASLQRGVSLSKTTLTKIIDYFVQRTLILPDGKAASTEAGGRKPSRYRFNPDFGFCIAYHIFPDELYSVITDLRTNVRASHSEPLAPDVSIEETVRRMVLSAGRLVAEVGTTLDAEPGGVVGIAVGAHGLTDYTDGILRVSPHFKNWPREARIRDLLAEAFPMVRHIVVDNQIRFQAIAERTHGIAKDRRNVIVIEAGIGLVAGIIVKDEVKRGSHSIAGEIGHMIVSPMSEEVCACGGQGCFEAMVTVDRVLRLAAAWRSRYPDSRIFVCSDEPDIDCIFAMAAEGDRLAVQLVDEVSRWFAIGISSTVLMYDPDLIVLQGIYARGGSCLLESIHRHIVRMCPVLEDVQVSLALSELGKDRGVLGGASMAVEAFLDALPMD